MTIKDLAIWLASRPRSRPCTTVVLHATAGSTAEGAISTLRLRGLSYHYLVAKSGQVIKCVPASRVAYHAGISSGPQGSNVNGYSVGISLVNRNDGADPYHEAQVAAVVELIGDLRRQLPLTHLTTHWAISPGRKTDPRRLDAVSIARACGLEFWA